MLGFNCLILHEVDYNCIGGKWDGHWLVLNCGVYAEYEISILFIATVDLYETIYFYTDIYSKVTM